MKLANFSLNHMGIYVIDIDAMSDFYTSFFGFVITDRRDAPNPIRFLTMTPTEHHQLLLASGRDPATPTTLHQMSFLLEDFAALRRVHDAAQAEPRISDIRGLDHGNSWALYFKDPEGNTVECYVHTDWHVDQPYGQPIDFSLSDQQIHDKTYAEILENPTFMSAVAAQLRLERKLSDAAA
jgi:catechol 2,3-dioxygenase